jgi:hypothetical protein
MKTLFMKTIHLFQFKKSISDKAPFFNEKYKLLSLNDLIKSDAINTEKVREFIIDVSDDFIFENTQKEDLLRICLNAKECIEHHFGAVFSNCDSVSV